MQQIFGWKLHCTAVPWQLQFQVHADLCLPPAKLEFWKPRWLTPLLHYEVILPWDVQITENRGHTERRLLNHTSRILPKNPQQGIHSPD